MISGYGASSDGLRSGFAERYWALKRSERSPLKNGAASLDVPTVTEEALWALLPSESTLETLWPCYSTGMFDP
jgi:hypothetical protein